MRGKRRRTGVLPVPSRLRKKLLYALLALLLGALGVYKTQAPASGRVEGVVTRVADGDTLTLQTGESPSGLKVRLYGIDAPEKDQVFGRESGEWLRDAVLYRRVVVEPQDRDRYGRLVGRVYVDGREINLESVRSGMAWYYEAYAKGDGAFARAQEEARRAGRGLWRDRSPVPPWEHRSAGRRGR